MPINHRRGPCRFCGKPVGKGKGLAQRSGRTGIWLAWHPRCDPMRHLPDTATPLVPRKPPYYADPDK